MSISDQLRKAITGSGKSSYLLAKETGVPQPTITRFLNAGADMKVSTVDRLAAHLGLVLVPAEQVKASKGKK